MSRLDPHKIFVGHLHSHVGKDKFERWLGEYGFESSLVRMRQARHEGAQQGCISLNYFNLP